MPIMPLKERLERADEEVAISQRNVARQREIIADLERRGEDVRPARRLLRELENTHRIAIALRKTLQNELAQKQPG